MLSLHSSSTRPGATSRAAAAAPLEAPAAHHARRDPPTPRNSPTLAEPLAMRPRRNSDPSPDKRVVTAYGRQVQVQVHGAEVPPIFAMAHGSRTHLHRSRSLGSAGHPLRDRQGRALEVRREIEQAGPPDAYASAALRKAAIAHLTHPDRRLTHTQSLAPQLDQVLQWSEREELQALWASLSSNAQPAQAEGTHLADAHEVQALLLERVADRLFKDRPLDRDAEIISALEQAKPLLAHARKKGPVLEALATRLRALFQHLSKEEIAWRLRHWESLPEKETPDEQLVRSLVILSLRIALQGTKATRVELLSPAAYGRLSGNKSQVWALQGTMMRQACAGMTAAERGQLQRLCLELRVPIGLPASKLEVVLRLRELMLRALHAHQAPETRRQRLEAISSLTDLAATVHEPLRHQLLMRGLEIRSLLPVEAFSTGRSRQIAQADGKSPRG